jgi:hypothetical protein
MRVLFSNTPYFLLKISRIYDLTTLGRTIGVSDNGCIAVGRQCSNGST